MITKKELQGYNDVQEDINNIVNIVNDRIERKLIDQAKKGFVTCTVDVRKEVQETLAMQPRRQIIVQSGSSAYEHLNSFTSEEIEKRISGIKNIKNIVDDYVSITLSGDSEDPRTIITFDWS